MFGGRFEGGFGSAPFVTCACFLLRFRLCFLLLFLAVSVFALVVPRRFGLFLVVPGCFWLVLVGLDCFCFGVVVSGCFVRGCSACLWLCLVVSVVPGCFWLLPVVSSCVWLFLVVSGCLWLCRVVSGSFLF